MEKSKFVWQEMFNNETGKTSGSAFVGVLTVIVSCVGFIFGCVTKNTEILSASTIFVGSGCALMGVRKYVNNKETPQSETE